MSFDRNAYLAIWRDENREKLRNYQRDYMAARRAANPEKAREESRNSNRNRRKEKCEEMRAYDREFYKKMSPEKKIERARAAREKYREKIRVIARRWCKNNPHKKNAETAKRRSRKKLAMPCWVNQREVAGKYQEAKTLTNITGIPHQVDHIVPLAGKLVCGLHVPWNLQVIPAILNYKKSNKWCP